MTVSLGELCKAVKATLEAAITVGLSQDYDELTESVVDLPMLQVYPEEGGGDPSSMTDRSTFGGSSSQKQERVVIHADYYAAERSDMAEDMAAVVAGLDAIRGVLLVLPSPLFGRNEVLSLTWEWRRALFDYGEITSKYMGVRFTLTLRVRQ